MASSLLTIPQELRNEIYSYLPEITTISLPSRVLRVDGQTAIRMLREALSSPAIAHVNKQLKADIDGSMRQNLEIRVEDAYDTHMLDNWLSTLPFNMIARIKTITLQFNMPGAEAAEHSKAPDYEVNDETDNKNENESHAGPGYNQG